MPVTGTVVNKISSGDTYKTIVDIVGPSSYTTGGETLTVAQQNQWMPQLGQAATVGFSVVLFFDSEVDSSLRSLVLDKANNRMMYTVVGAQAGSGTNQAAVIRCEFTYGSVNKG